MGTAGKSISVSVHVVHAVHDVHAVRNVHACEAKLRGSASAVMIPAKVGVGGRLCGVWWRAFWRRRCSAGFRPVPGARRSGVPGSGWPVARCEIDVKSL